MTIEQFIKGMKSADNSAYTLKDLITKLSLIVKDIDNKDSGGIQITVNVNNTFEDPVENAFYVIKKDGSVQSFDVPANRKSTFTFTDVVAVGQESPDYSIDVISGISFEYKDTRDEHTYRAFVTNGIVSIEFVM